MLGVLRIAMSGKIIVLEDFQKMYEPLLQYLESITSADGWGGNSVIRALGHSKSIANSTFIAAFHTIKYLFGWFSIKLHGSECDILKTLQIIDTVKAGSTKWYK